MDVERRAALLLRHQQQQVEQLARLQQRRSQAFEALLAGQAPHGQLAEKLRVEQVEASAALQQLLGDAEKADFHA